MTHNNYSELQRKIGEVYETFYEIGEVAEEQGNVSELENLKTWVNNKKEEVINWAVEHDAEHGVLVDIENDFDTMLDTINESINEL